MMLKILFLIVLCSVEIIYSASGEQKPVSSIEVWSPLTWWIPFRIAQAESWSSYLKATQQASSRLQNLIRSYLQSVRIFSRVKGKKQKEENMSKGNRTTTKKRKPNRTWRRRRKESDYGATVGDKLVKMKFKVNLPKKGLKKSPINNNNNNSLNETIER